MEINHQPVRMLLDTGAEFPILFKSTAARLRIETTTPDENEKPIKGKVFLGETDLCELKILGKTSIIRLKVFDVPEDTDFGSMEGLINWGMLKNQIVKFDALEHKIYLLNELPLDVKSWVKVPLSKDSDVLKLEIPKLGGRPSKIAVDTGVSGEIALSHDNWKKWKNDHPSDLSTLKIFYMPGSGTIISEIMWAKKISIRGIELTNVRIRESTPTEEAMTGSGDFEASFTMEALNRMDFIVDDRSGFAYLLPKTSEVSSVDHNRAGALFDTKDDESNDLLAHVLPGSPAEEAGVRNGDILLKINFQDVTQWKQGNTPRFSVAAAQPAGTKITLLLKRDEKQFEAVITLRDILGPSAIKP